MSKNYTIKEIVLRLGCVFVFIIVLFAVFVVMLAIEISRDDPKDFTDKYHSRIAGNIWYKNEPFSKEHLVFTSKNLSFVPVDVTDYRSNDSIIVVKQHRIHHLDCRIPNGLIISEYPEAKDSIYYWMILVPTDQFIGPLTHDSIEQLYETYNVDISLQL